MDEMGENPPQMENKAFQIIPRPENISWEEIRQTIWQAHAGNRTKGIYMRHFQLSAEEIRERIEAEGGEMFVAVAGGRVIGTAAVVPRYFRLWCGEGMYAYCCFAAVLPAWRGKGIYRELCQVRESYARARSFRWMLFEIHQRNERLLTISRQIGCRPVGCQYWDDHYNHLMVKWLVGMPPSRFQCAFRFALSRLRAGLLPSRKLQAAATSTQVPDAPLIIGQGYSGRLSLARSLAPRNGKVTLVSLVTYRKDGKKLNRKRQIDAFSRTVDRVLYCASDDEAMLRDLLRKETVRTQGKRLLVPDNDFSAYYVDACQEELRPYFCFPHVPGDPGAVARWMDKSRQKELARSVGLAVPASVVVDLQDAAPELPEAVSYPCFVKPLASRMGRKWSMRRCETPAQLADCLQFMRRNFGPIQVLVEAYMQIDTEYATVGFSDGKEVIIPGYIEMNVMGHGRHFGVAVQGRVCPPGRMAPVLEQFKDLVLKTGFHGLFDIDFYESGGTLYFCELNLRFGGSGYAFTRCGVNLPEMMARSFSGQSLDGYPRELTRSAVFFNERVAMEDWYEGYLSLQEYRRLRDEADIPFIEDAADPGPGRALQRKFRLWRIRRMLKKSFGKNLEWKVAQ